MGAGCSGALPRTIPCPGDLHKNNDPVAGWVERRIGPVGSAGWPIRTHALRCGRMGRSVGMSPSARGTLVLLIRG